MNYQRRQYKMRSAYINKSCLDKKVRFDTIFGSDSPNQSFHTTRSRVHDKIDQSILNARTKHCKHRNRCVNHQIVGAKPISSMLENPFKPGSILEKEANEFVDTFKVTNERESLSFLVTGNAVDNSQNRVIKDSLMNEEKSSSMLIQQGTDVYTGHIHPRLSEYELEFNHMSNLDEKTKLSCHGFCNIV
ncbi:hypothetical protein ACOME3_009622 [Neoechinorhynchus agilis]